MARDLTFPRRVVTTFGQTIDPCGESEFADLSAQGVIERHQASSKDVPDQVETHSPYATPEPEGDAEEDADADEAPAPTTTKEA